MDFDLVLKNLLEGFDRLKIRYAALGAFAMGLLKAPRATSDLDFMVHRDDLKSLDLLMGSLRYHIIFRSDNVTQFGGENPLWGYVDFIHAFRPIGLEMLQDAISKPIFGGKARIRVLRPEDVAGLKVQSMANVPDRRDKDAVDIEALIRANVTDIDWERLKRYYALFNMEADFERLRRKLHAP